MKRLFCFTFLLFSHLAANIQTLYNSLDPKSVSQHLALYSLYPDTPFGKKALQDAWNLLSGTGNPTPLPAKLPEISSLIGLIQKRGSDSPPELSQESLQAIGSLGARLQNRRLKGHLARTEQELAALSPDEIDIGRAVLLEDPNLESYEAMLDLMALQILARLPQNPSPRQMIEEINRLIFEQMRFRFPPHSVYAKEIDHYTFLPSVLDSRQGVCLGVSTLYLAIAQRIGLPLEMVTPPGHIYVRYKDQDQTINIETTCRGIHMDDEAYLSVDTCKLQMRTAKEVIGLISINHASIYLQDGSYDKALACYKKAAVFLPEDFLLRQLMGCCHLMLGQEQEGYLALKEVAQSVDCCSVSPHMLAADLLAKKGDKECLEALFYHIDEKRASILAKKDRLEEVVKKHPEFRDGWFSLAGCWLQLHRQKEALEILERCHELSPDDSTCNYYLAVLHVIRFNYPMAAKYLTMAERVTSQKGHYPKALKELRRELASVYPGT